MERPHIPWYACCIERKGTSPLTESLREKQFWENWIKITDGVTQCHSREYWTLWNKFDLNIFAICPLSNKVKTLSLSVPLKEHFLNNDPAHFFLPHKFAKLKEKPAVGTMVAQIIPVSATDFLVSRPSPQSLGCSFVKSLGFSLVRTFIFRVSLAIFRYVEK